MQKSRTLRPFPVGELPHLLRAQVEAGRRLLSLLPLEPGPDWPAACRALGGAVTLTVTDAFVLSAAELLGHVRGAALRIAAGSRQAMVVVDPQLAPRLARRALGVEGPELPAPRPLTLAEEGALEFLVAALLGPSLRVDGVVRDGELPFSAGASAWIWGVSAKLSTPAGEGWAKLYAPESVRLAAPPPVAAALAKRAGRLERARVELRLGLGVTLLPARELAGLGVGDVVLFGQRPETLALRLGAGRFRARLDGDSLTIEEPFRLEKTMPNEDAGELYGELPVEVTCELGRVTMTGREVLELRPGAVVPVGRPLSGPVDLVVGGRVVARGELVDVDGEIGVRVTQTID